MLEVCAPCDGLREDNAALAESAPGVQPSSTRSRIESLIIEFRRLARSFRKLIAINCKNSLKLVQALGKYGDLEQAPRELFVAQSLEGEANFTMAQMVPLAFEIKEYFEQQNNAHSSSCPEQDLRLPEIGSR